MPPLLAPLLMLATATPVHTESLADLLHREDVQVEIRFTPAQRKRWGEVDRVPEPKRGGTFEADVIEVPEPALQEKSQAERERKAFELLKPDQAVRLIQLYVQWAGPRAILREDVRQALELTDDQVSRVRRAKAQRDMALLEVRRKLAEQKGEIGRPDPKRVADLLERIERQLDEALDAVPNQTQRNRLADMAGKKFIFAERVFKSGE